MRGACFGKDSPCVSLAEELVEFAIRVCCNEDILCASLSVGAIFASLRRSGNLVQVLPEAGRTAKCVAVQLDLCDALVRKSILVHCERCSTSGQTTRFVYVVDWRHLKVDVGLQCAAQPCGWDTCPSLCRRRTFTTLSVNLEASSRLR